MDDTYYPAGTHFLDPRAPWNVPDAIYCAGEDCDNEVEVDGDLCEGCDDE